MADQNSNGLVIHVSSLNDRSTEVVMRDVIRIGASEECDVKIRLPQTAATVNGPVIELARQNGVYRIANVDATLEVRLNGRPIKPNRGIYDGDEIWIGPSGPSIHFFPIEASAALVPGRRAAHARHFKSGHAQDPLAGRVAARRLWRRRLPDFRVLYVCGSRDRAPFALSDRKSTRLNSSHDQISYAVFCLKKKKIKAIRTHMAKTHSNQEQTRKN